MKSIYKHPEAKSNLMALYDEKLASIGIPTRSSYVETRYGKTHILEAGPETAPPVIYLHGINAGAPLTLEALKGLAGDYRLIGIDTIGQATRSDETRLPLQGPDIGNWLKEVIQGIGIAKASWIGVSYGAFLLQKIMESNPACIEKAIFVVPSGLVNGSFWPSFRHLSIPLMKFLLTGKESVLVQFMSAFYEDIDDWSIRFQRATLQGTHMDYRRPPLAIRERFVDCKAPVFIMAADTDIFFPGEQAIEQAKTVFPGFEETYMLRSCRHIPGKTRYAEMESKIRDWLKK